MYQYKANCTLAILPEWYWYIIFHLKNLHYNQTIWFSAKLRKFWAWDVLLSVPPHFAIMFPSCEYRVVKITFPNFGVSSRHEPSAILSESKFFVIRLVTTTLAIYSFFVYFNTLDLLTSHLGLSLTSQIKCIHPTV